MELEVVELDGELSVDEGSVIGVKDCVSRRIVNNLRCLMEVKWSWS